jgi:hypothetical protein
VGWAEYPRAHNATTTTSAHLASDCFFSPVVENSLFIFFNSFFQKYTTISKFISFDHQPSWRMAAAMGYGGRSLD